MGYLIDTHIFLWFVSGDKKLPKNIDFALLKFSRKIDDLGNIFNSNYSVKTV